jgi:hypothetical protein
MRTEARLYAALDAAGIAYRTHEYPAVFTVEESAAIKSDIACLHTKNLFLKDADGAFFLLTVPAEARIDMKRVYPLRNTATIVLTGTDILAAARDWGHDPRVVDLSKIEGG